MHPRIHNPSLWICLCASVIVYYMRPVSKSLAIDSWALSTPSQNQRTHLFVTSESIYIGQSAIAWPMASHHILYSLYVAKTVLKFMVPLKRIL